MQFDHEKLDVYRAALDFNRLISVLVASLSGTHRHIRDQLIRAALSVPLNIVEGNGKRSQADRRRFFEIARGSAMESAAALDVHVAVGACRPEAVTPFKELLLRIVAMLTKMTAQPEDR